MNESIILMAYIMLPLRICTLNFKQAFSSGVFEILRPKGCPPMCNLWPSYQAADRRKLACRARKIAPVGEIKFKSTPAKIIGKPLCTSHFLTIHYRSTGQ